jgi:hypothetical protein
MTQAFFKTATSDPQDPPPLSKLLGRHARVSHSGKPNVSDICGHRTARAAPQLQLHQRSRGGARPTAGGADERGSMGQWLPPVGEGRMAHTPESR